MLVHGPLPQLVVQAVIIISLSRAVGLVARKLNQPMVIAEILAGIALGPSLLGWLLPHTSAVLFPRDALGTLSLLSQVGLILFMFLVGLELDAKLLRGRGRASVAISQTGMIAPFALGTLASFYLYSRLSPRTIPFMSFALFMGAAMSVTAFPVLARVLVERRLLRTRVGTITIACAAVDDVSAWCILAFVVAIVRFTGVGNALITTGLALAYIAFMVLVVKPLLYRFADRSRTREALSQNLVAAVLVLMLVSSWATELIGIHALFGAFILGAIIPKTGGFARLLAEKLEDLVVVFMLPLFFAYSGLRTQIGLLSTPADWLTCGFIIFIACAGKFGGCALAARLTGIRWREATALGILMNTRGLMELIILNIGLDLGVIPPKLFTMLVLMALVTTVMTTPLLEWVYPQSELERDLVQEPTPETAPEPVFTMLLCVAFERSGPAMASLASALGGDRVYALELVRPADRASFVLRQSQNVQAASSLTPLLERAGTLGLEVRPLSFVSPKPSRDICNVALAKQANLVLLGWHKPLFGRAALGGTVHEVMEQAPADVAVLIDRGLTRIDRVLVPYLGSEHDHAALRIVHRLAHSSGVEVTILHVVTPNRSRRAGVAEQLAQLSEPGERGNTRVTIKLVEHTDPAEAAIIESHGDYDLLVVGADSQWGLEHRVFGLQPERVIRHCPISILVVSDSSVEKARATAEPARSLTVETQGA